MDLEKQLYGSMFIGLCMAVDYNILVKQPVANQMKPVSVLTVL